MNVKIIKASSFVLILLLTVGALELTSYLTTANTKGSSPGRIIFVDLPRKNNNIILYDQKVYAFSSTVDQTDSDPFTTASGSRVRDGIIANNCYSFGTRVEIRGRQYEVQDRLNSRYGVWKNNKYCIRGNTEIWECFNSCENAQGYWDLWFPDRESALEFGVKILNVLILDS